MYHYDRIAHNSKYFYKQLIAILYLISRKTSHSDDSYNMLKTNMLKTNMTKNIATLLIIDGQE